MAYIPNGGFPSTYNSYSNPLGSASYAQPFNNSFGTPVSNPQGSGYNFGGGHFPNSSSGFNPFGAAGSLFNGAMQLGGQAFGGLGQLGQSGFNALGMNGLGNMAGGIGQLGQGALSAAGQTGQNLFNSTGNFIPPYLNPINFVNPFPGPEQVLGAFPDLAFILNGNPQDTRLGYNSGWEQRLTQWILSPRFNTQNGPTLAGQLRALFDSLLSVQGTTPIIINGRQSNLYTNGPSNGLLAGWINNLNNPSGVQFIDRVLLPIQNALRTVVQRTASMPGVSDQIAQGLLGTIEEFEALQQQTANLKELLDSSELARGANNVFNKTTTALRQSIAGNAGSQGGAQGGAPGGR